MLLLQLTAATKAHDVTNPCSDVIIVRQIGNVIFEPVADIRALVDQQPATDDVV